MVLLAMRLGIYNIHHEPSQAMGQVPDSYGEIAETARTPEPHPLQCQGAMQSSRRPGGLARSWLRLEQGCKNEHGTPGGLPPTEPISYKLCIHLSHVQSKTCSLT